MDEIQKDYLVGLVLKKIQTFDQYSLKELNVNSAKFNESIENFIYKCSDTTDLPKKISNFLKSKDSSFNDNNITVEKDGDNITTTFNEDVFTLTLKDYQMLVNTIKGYFTNYLPIGSIVKLVNDENPLVIEQRMVRPKGENYYIDYRGIPYPMGIFNESMYVYFSASDIEQVVFTGYSDSENDGYELALKESLIDNNIFEKEDELEN